MRVKCLAEGHNTISLTRSVKPCFLFHTGVLTGGVEPCTECLGNHGVHQQTAALSDWSVQGGPQPEHQPPEYEAGWNY